MNFWSLQNYWKYLTSFPDWQEIRDSHNHLSYLLILLCRICRLAGDSGKHVTNKPWNDWISRKIIILWRKKVDIAIIYFKWSQTVQCEWSHYKHIHAINSILGLWCHYSPQLPWLWQDRDRVHYYWLQCAYKFIFGFYILSFWLCCAELANGSSSTITEEYSLLTYDSELRICPSYQPKWTPIKDECRLCFVWHFISCNLHFYLFFPFISLIVILGGNHCHFLWSLYIVPYSSHPCAGLTWSLIPVL